MPDVEGDVPLSDTNVEISCDFSDTDEFCKSWMSLGDDDDGGLPVGGDGDSADPRPSPGCCGR